MEQTLNLFDDSGWVDALGYPAGTKQKVLTDEKGVKTFLIRYPQGTYMAAHSHTFAEQHFILEGNYICDGKLYPAGTIRYFKPGDVHGPFESQRGALILIFWYPW